MSNELNLAMVVFFTFGLIYHGIIQDVSGMFFSVIFVFYFGIRFGERLE